MGGYGLRKRSHEGTDMSSVMAKLQGGIRIIKKDDHKNF